MREIVLKQVNIDTEIDSLVLTDYEITANEIPANDLFEVKIKDQIHGPIYKDDLRKYFFFHKEVLPEARIKKVNVKGEWTSPTEHPIFQRRRPQVISRTEVNREKDEFHTIVHGQKTGPFTFYEVMDMLKHEKLFSVDMISIDNGMSWKKVYEFAEFDRRKLKQNLPSSPVRKNRNYSEEVKPNKNQIEEDDNLINLAAIKNLKNNSKGGVSEDIVNEDERKMMEEIELLNSTLAKRNKYIISSIIAVLILAALSIVVKFSSGTPDIIRTTPTKVTADQKSKVYKLTPTTKKTSPRPKAPVTQRTPPAKRIIPRKTVRRTVEKAPPPPQRETELESSNIEDEEFEEDPPMDQNVDVLEAEVIEELPTNVDRKTVNERLTSDQGFIIDESDIEGGFIEEEGAEAELFEQEASY